MKIFSYFFAILILISGLLVNKAECSNLLQEDAVDQILNGKIHQEVNYFDELAKLDEETDPSSMAYAYQLLGTYFMYEKDYSQAAKAYYLSLDKYSLNEELKQHLYRLGISDYSEQNIENGLKKALENQQR